MKGFLRNVLLLLIGVSLVSCSNTSKQNVGVATGAVAGGLVGSLFGAGSGKALAVVGGAVAGALIGGAIGKNMDENDAAKTNAALNQQIGQPTHWTNPKTGVSYTIVPTKRMTVNGNPNCVKYYTTAVVNGKSQRVYGAACRASNGTWQPVGM